MKLTDEERSLAMPALAHGDWAAVYAESDVERIVAARLAAVEAYRQRCAITRTEPTLAGLTTALRADSSEAPA